MTTAFEKLQADTSAVHRTHGRLMDAINADERLSEYGRQARHAALFVETRRSLVGLVDEFDAKVTARRAELESIVFKPPAGVPAADSRDALDRVDALGFEDESAALRMLERAERTGDVALAQAVAAVGAERGWATATARYAEPRPAVGEALMSLTEMNAAPSDPNVVFAVGMMRTPVRPRALQDVNDAEVERLAAQFHDGSADQAGAAAAAYAATH